MSETACATLPRLPSGVPGFDFVTRGGLLADRATLVSGSAGCGKTVFACQFLAAGIADYGERGVFVTFEETPAAIRRNMAALGWDIAAWEQSGDWAFVDASPDLETPAVEVGAFDLEALLQRIRAAVERIGAVRLAFDSASTAFAGFADGGRVRTELRRIIAALGDTGVTSVVTAERGEGDSQVADFGVEEFVADAVVVLRNVPAADRRRRTLEVLKMRGAPHHVGEVPFSIGAGRGIEVIPLGALELDQPGTAERRTSGNPELDQLCGGGWYADAVAVVSGASGCGKTLLATQFAAAGAAAGERSLYLAFEESPEQLERNAASWGLDLAAQVAAGRLRIESAYPETDTLEGHLARIKQLLAEFAPDRVAVDSLSALERVAGSELAYRQFLVGLTASLKHAGAMTLYTAASNSLVGSDTAAGLHVSTLTDTILVMRYVESGSAVRRALTVLKMRGSGHDRAVREFDVGPGGLRIGKPFADNTGILSAGGVPGAPDAARG